MSYYYDDGDSWKKRYHKDLEDERWHQRSSQIRERDNHTCQDCRVEGGVLQVHHNYYAKGEYWRPWQYPDSALVTLCVSCHDKRHEHKINSFYPSTINKWEEEYQARLVKEKEAERERLKEEAHKKFVKDMISLARKDMQKLSNENAFGEEGLYDKLLGLAINADKIEQYQEYGTYDQPDLEPNELIKWYIDKYDYTAYENISSHWYVKEFREKKRRLEQERLKKEREEKQKQEEAYKLYMEKLVKKPAIDLDEEKEDSMFVKWLKLMWYLKWFILTGLAFIAGYIYMLNNHPAFTLIMTFNIMVIGTYALFRKGY